MSGVAWGWVRVVSARNGNLTHIYHEQPQPLFIFYKVD